MKFLVGYNGSDVAKEVLALAAEHAKLFKAKVLVVSSLVGGSGENPADVDKARQDLVFAEKFLKENSVSCETYQLARGRAPGEDLVNFADEHEVDQIYVGVEKKSRTQKIIVGSNAQYIILKASCPVVSVNRSTR